MLARVISVGIIAFWLVMMTLLIRSELLETKPLAYAVPVETVMQKIFEGQEPSDLEIYYQGKRVGRCTLEATRDRQSPAPAYNVQSSVSLSFDLLGKSVRLVSETDSRFDRRYQMTRFHSRTVSGDSVVELDGDLASQQLQFALHLGDGYEEKHTMPFATLERMGPSGAMGLFGMGGLQLPDSARAKSANALMPAVHRGTRGPDTHVEEIVLTAGKQKITTLVVHTTYDESLWSKVYVSPMGEVLKVETSFGVTMCNAQLSGETRN